MRARIGRLAVVGALAMMSPGASVATGASTNPKQTWVSPDGLHAYTCYNGTLAVGQFSRGTDGKLQALGTPTVASGNGPVCITGSPDGAHVYVTCSGSDYIRQYSRNAGTGQLAGLGTPTIATGVYPVGIAMSADGLFVYCVNRNPGGGGSVSCYSRNTGNGQLTSLGTAVACGSQPQGIVIVGDFLYTTNGGDNTISQFSRNSGTGVINALTPATVATGAFPTAPVASSDGKNIYICNDANGAATSLGMYTRDTGTGLLVLLGTTNGGAGPFSMAISTDGLHVYAGASDGQLIYQYDRNAGTGNLSGKTPPSVRSDPTFTTTTGSGGPQGITLSPDGKHLYSTQTLAGFASITQFHVKQ